MGGIYEVGVEMCSGAMKYILSFMKTDPGIQKLMGGGIHRYTNSMVISYAYFYFLKISRQKK
jgi:hypothetical protein